MSLIGTLQKPVFGRLPRIINPCGIPMPVGLWLSNEGSGSRVSDLSGNKKDGTVIGATWTSGKFGHALYFDGTNSDIVRVPIDLAGWTKLTISMWWLCDNLAIDQAMATHHSVGEYYGSEQLVINWDTSTSGVDFTVYGTGGTDQLKDVAVGFSQSKWHHLVFTWDGSDRQRMYVDGVLKRDEAAIGGAIVADAAPGIDFGFYHAGTQLIGKIDVPTIWNDILIAQQIAQLYRDPFPWFKRDPIELWSAAMAGAPPGISMPLVMQQMNQFSGGIIV